MDTVQNRPGYVYIIKAENGLYKIGKTRNIIQRLGSLFTMSPVKLTVLHTIKTNDAYHCERELHENYREYRSHGEWFRLPNETVQHLLSYAEIFCREDRYLEGKP